MTFLRKKGRKIINSSGGCLLAKGEVRSVVRSVQSTFPVITQIS